MFSSNAWKRRELANEVTITVHIEETPLRLRSPCAGIET
jgi:hypothetical protein